MMRTTPVMSLAILCCVTGGCLGSPETRDPIEARQLPESLRADASPVVDGNTRFALDLYRVLSQKDEGNLFLSPFSISTAFAMTYAGARGQTESEMAAVFHFSLDQDRLHPVFGALLQSLDTGAGFDGYRLNIANRLWGDREFTLLPAYLDVTREQYGAELAQLDFHDAEVSRQTINDWVEGKTAGKIKDLIPQGMIDDATKLILTNAIYFKGLWLSRFDPAKTKDMDFHVSAEKTVQVPMMHQTGRFQLGGTKDVQILDLPYRTEDISMLFLLPATPDGLGPLEAQVSAEALQGWMETLREVEADLFIPRFRVESEFSLAGTLSKMGMPSAFTDQADFSGMDGRRDLLIQDAVHKAYVLVNEEGTEAAAATGVGMGTTSVPPTFRADHPFLILIRDRVTGSILFVGRVVDPAAA